MCSFHSVVSCVSSVVPSHVEHLWHSVSEPMPAWSLRRAPAWQKEFTYVPSSHLVHSLQTASWPAVRMLPRTHGSAVHVPIVLPSSSEQYVHVRHSVSVKYVQARAVYSCSSHSVHATHTVSAFVSWSHGSLCHLPIGHTVQGSQVPAPSGSGTSEM